MLFAITILSVVDVELFRHWGFRLDTTPLLYLKNPKEALTSIPISRSILLIILGIAWYAMVLNIFSKVVYPLFDMKGRAGLLVTPFFLILAAACILPIRGSLGTAPMNHAFVFFSNQSLANQAAINMPWNLMHALTHMDRLKEYKFMPNEEAELIANSYLNSPNCEQVQVMNTDRPNVIIVVLESFSAFIVESLGGDPRVTPNLNELAKEGILFSNFYADGYRTERGLVAVASGYPAQPVMPVISINSKVQKLPSIAKELLKEGYGTAFYYGGDINFVNTRGYVLSAGYQRYTTRSEFTKKQEEGTTWGAHDEYVYERMLKDLDTVSTPFFYTFLTLSSHEPYGVPMPTAIEGTSEEDKFKNSAYYADKCLGDFINRAKQKIWWDNTVVIFVADHGKRNSYNLANYDPRIYHIPMVWVGGALKKQNLVVDKLGSQRDIATTLLSQMRIPTKQFKFSKNMFNLCEPSYAMYVYKGGFGFLKDSTTVVYSNDVNGVIQEQNADSLDVIHAKALFQLFNEDFLGL
jgi:phosphoglycerol transferase MdoB-like AlkP superfamily enzyme